MYTKPDKMNITPARNKDGIVIRCINQYRRSCKISINGRSPVDNFVILGRYFLKLSLVINLSDDSLHFSMDLLSFLL